MNTGRADKSTPVGGRGDARTRFPHMEKDLTTLDSAVNYRQWMYRQIQPILGARILEVGSGIGNYTTFLRKHGDVLATDADPHYVGYLKQQLADVPRVQVRQLTLGNWDRCTRDSLRDFQPDSIVCLNVLEHVADDKGALKSLISILPAGGKLALIVPALPALFCPMDERYGHYRRYTRKGLRGLLERTPEVKVLRCRYVNTIGVAGWWFNHVLLKRVNLSSSQTQVYDRWLVPITAYAERICPALVGLSVVAWAQKAQP